MMPRRAVEMATGNQNHGQAGGASGCRPRFVRSADASAAAEGDQAITRGFRHF